MSTVTILIMGWISVTTLVMVQGTIVVRLRCGCGKTSEPVESYPPVLILIQPQTSQPAEVSQWACWIKQEIFQHYTQNLIAVCMSLCPTSSQVDGTSDHQTGPDEKIRNQSSTDGNNQVCDGKGLGGPTITGRLCKRVLAYIKWKLLTLILMYQ
jgi:hypothetical protein